MRGRELKPLMPPQLVEARREEHEASPMASPTSTKHTHQLSHSSAASDVTAPISPSTTSRHSRLPSSTSSLPSSPSVRESADGFASAKRPLTDVKEEPVERDDYDMVDVSFDRRTPNCKYWHADTGRQGARPSNRSRRELTR